MGFYSNRILPLVIDMACSSRAIMDLRANVVPHCRGQVLEVGAGSGINFALYDPAAVDSVWALEPSLGMRRKARRNFAGSPVPVQWLDLPGEEIPLDDRSVDTVLLTYTLCTIPDHVAALRQMYRVLKPGGRLMFCEHGRAPEAGIQRWQDRITPLWKRCTGGCHLNRPIARYIEDAGFDITQLHNVYADMMPRIAAYMYWGEARRGPEAA